MRCCSNHSNRARSAHDVHAHVSQSCFSRWTTQVVNDRLADGLLFPLNLIIAASHPKLHSDLRKEPRGNTRHN